MDCLEFKQVGKYLCGAASSKGCGDQNQDRFRITPKGILLLDGIGGRAAGEVYAELGAWKGEQLLSEGLEASAVLDEASFTAREVEGALREHGGAAACAVRFTENGGYDIACRGDVRAYLLGANEALSLTNPDTDHNGRLTCYMGSLSEAYSKNRSVSIMAEDAKGKTLLVASDGVWKYVSLRECVKVSRLHSNPRDVAQAIVDVALSCATPDDATVVICRSVE